ncbi:hypothetical protein [Burkholderia sp. 22313]|uniref:hypothetical protein n=1 Tax=Burkholderia sp. 22313 TaxID=3453908 RepID=UPI003F8343AE
MTSRVGNHGSTTDHPSTHEAGTTSKDKSKGTNGDPGGSQADLDAAIQAFGSQVMMQIFQDQQERRAEEREEDPDSA